MILPNLPIMSRAASRTVLTIIIEINIPEGRWRFNLLYDLKRGLHGGREFLG